MPSFPLLNLPILTFKSRNSLSSLSLMINLCKIVSTFDVTILYYEHHITASQAFYFRLLHLNFSIPPLTAFRCVQIYSNLCLEWRKSSPLAQDQKQEIKLDLSDGVCLWWEKWVTQKTVVGRWRGSLGSFVKQDKIGTVMSHNTRCLESRFH